ncbi:hypothetical protein [Candidatus Xianfuyuplasma coldseepsis]|uniref:Uncharacterized protein n=1 Tax=Candidatus Xianfuyuplasma coldseepsis TaxID=2782163 RepID=A0A7L7KNQ0_9MOLU|nr:hypothetical protein [Xianfuyuplasma coldseepsis]QMS84267.1 hypothetical protein G4Z02_00435 [Xianfuyuplasma coldseepsis]
MSPEAITFLVIGILDIVLAWTGIMSKLPRGRRWADRIGDTNAKIMYSFFGVLFIVIALFFL